MTPNQEASIALATLKATVEAVTRTVLRSEAGRGHASYAARSKMAEEMQECLRDAFARAYDAVGMLGVGHEKFEPNIRLSIDTALLAVTQDEFEPAWDRQRELAAEERAERGRDLDASRQEAMEAAE